MRKSVCRQKDRVQRVESGKYTGKDDPVMLVRVQKMFPATGEVLAPYAVGPYVAGSMRGSHHMPLMPVGLNSDISYFAGPPVVSCAAFASLCLAGAFAPGFALRARAK